MSYLKKLLAGVAGLVSASSLASVDITHDEFVFTIAGDWKQLASQDPDQFNFESKTLKSTIVISITNGISVPQDRLVDVAKKFLELRVDAEREARAGVTLEFGDSWAKLQPSGDVAELGYAGFDPQSGTVFRFLGYATQRKVVSFWLATESKDTEASRRVFDEAFKGFKFYVP
jgi:hypothetical protein